MDLTQKKFHEIAEVPPVLYDLLALLCYTGGGGIIKSGTEEKCEWVISQKIIDRTIHL